MGWEPAEVTSFEYDGDRLVRQVTVREPEFTRAERALLLASRRHEAGLNRFGIPWKEATDPANQFRQRFEGFSRMDYSEKAVEDFKEAFFKKYPDASRNGLQFGVRRATDE
jgi:hypothetical protein